MVPDRAGFEGFYAGHLPRVLRACTLVLLERGDAADVAEAFARLWSHWSQIHGDGPTGGPTRDGHLDGGGASPVA